MPKWQVISAKAGHYCLYILMGMLIVTGILSANYTADPIIVFGTLNLSSEVENIQMFNLIRGIHEFATNAIIALITIHILAALYHQFIAKDDTTLNMTKFWTSKLNNE
jgi:cytochrome b561